MVDTESINLGSEYNEINLFRSAILGDNHFNDDDLVDVCNHEFPSAPVDLLICHEYFNLDLQSDLVKEDVLIKTSSSSHYCLCSTIYDEPTCNRDTPCSSSS